MGIRRAKHGTAEDLNDRLSPVEGTLGGMDGV